MQKILFVDRDGTLISEPKDTYQVERIEQFSFLPHTISSLKQLSHAGFDLVLVSNQDGLGTESLPEDRFWPLHALMQRILVSEGINFLSEHIDPTFSNNPGPGRKPGTAMLKGYLASPNWDRSQSFVIGDRVTDLQLADNMGIRGILLTPDLTTEEREKALAQLAQLNQGRTNDQHLHAESWAQICALLLHQHDRVGRVQRNTSETQISVQLNLDRVAPTHCQTGIGFFDHMLDQIGRHGQLGLSVLAKGDLHIDTHHTIEDVGIAIGQALRQAVGDKRGIERYGFWLPMDEADAAVTLDLSGRFYLHWDVAFTDTQVAGIPTTLFQHFFYSLANAAAMNLHIVAKGEDNHHVIEAVFKAFARTLRRAVTRQTGDGALALPSTKGVL